MIDGYLYMLNPARTLPRWAVRMMQLWTAAKNGVLPHGGGPMDEAVILLDALQIMSAAYAEEERGQRRGR